MGMTGGSSAVGVVVRWPVVSQVERVDNRGRRSLLGCDGNDGTTDKTITVKDMDTVERSERYENRRMSGLRAKDGERRFLTGACTGRRGQLVVLEDRLGGGNMVIVRVM